MIPIYRTTTYLWQVKNIKCVTFRQSWLHCATCSLVRWGLSLSTLLPQLWEEWLDRCPVFERCITLYRQHQWQLRLSTHQFHTMECGSISHSSTDYDTFTHIFSNRIWYFISVHICTLETHIHSLSWSTACHVSTCRHLICTANTNTTHKGSSPGQSITCLDCHIK